MPESLLAASKRWQLGAGRESLALQREDLHCLEPKKSQTLNICLLIDASASMAGERMRSAKYLAQHLLLATRDRVAVIVFQEREARLVVPFTRNVARVQQGLLEIKPYGLTPPFPGPAVCPQLHGKGNKKEPLPVVSHHRRHSHRFQKHQ